MAETSTIARPYARAVFDLAHGAGTLKQWSETLGLLADVAGDPDMRTIIESPRYSNAQTAEMLVQVCNERLDDRARNFVKLLAENDRLAQLPEIAAIYETLRADAEGTLEARVVSAFPLSERQTERIAAALKARLGREVTLECETDPSLVGGALIRAGDLVIDGTVRGRLGKLATALT